MKLYGVSYRRRGQEHDGYRYFTNKAKATHEQNIQNKKENCEDSIREISFELSKKGILTLLNHYAGHPDNG